MRTRDQIAEQLQSLKSKNLWEEMKMQLTNDTLEVLLDIREMVDKIANPIVYVNEDQSRNLLKDLNVPEHD